MERTKHKKPDAILCADIHLREKKPIARTDDYYKTQWRKLKFISDLQEKYGCAIINAGDLFNHWKPSPQLLTETMQFFPKGDFYTIYGQHDLPNHNLKLAYRSGIATLQEAKRVIVLHGRHYGQGEMILNYTDMDGNPPKFQMLVWHYMTYKDEKPFPQHKGPSALRILKKYPQYDLIVTGDNHIPFVEEYKGRMLVNPGSMMRITAKQIDHKPRVYLWYADTNTVTPVYLPIEEGVISREHIDKVQDRDDRIDAFITKLSGDWEAEMSFEDNLKKAVNANKIPKLVQDIIYKAIES